MRFLRQLSIILALSSLGELLALLIPLPIPGSIYGLAVFFLLLLSGLIPLSAVEEAAERLIELMPICFVIPGLAIIEKGKLLGGFVLPFLLIICISSLLVFGLTGRLSQRLLYRQEHRGQAHAHPRPHTKGGH